LPIDKENVHSVQRLSSSGLEGLKQIAT